MFNFFIAHSVDYDRHSYSSYEDISRPIVRPARTNSINSNINYYTNNNNNNNTSTTRYNQYEAPTTNVMRSSIPSQNQPSTNTQTVPTSTPHVQQSSNPIQNNNNNASRNSASQPVANANPPRTVPRASSPAQAPQKQSQQPAPRAQQSASAPQQ